MGPTQFIDSLRVGHLPPEFSYRVGPRLTPCETKPSIWLRLSFCGAGCWPVTIKGEKETAYAKISNKQNVQMRADHRLEESNR